MVHSKFFSLADLTFEELKEHHECPYDQGGYFIINGSEKVLIAQERLAYNYVYIFKYASPSTTLYSAEFLRTVNLKLVTKTFAEDKAESSIHVALPFIKKDIPIRVLFLASTMRTSSIVFCLDPHDPEILKIEESTMICISPDELYESRLYNLRKLEGLRPRRKRRSVHERLINLPTYPNKWTHCEIHPSMILEASCNHKSYGILQFRELPAGINVIVVLCYGGYNQEDSLIINQSSFDRGLFRSFTYRRYLDQEKVGVLNMEDIIKPNPYMNLGLNVEIMRNLMNDILIGKLELEIREFLKLEINSQVVMVKNEPMESIIVKIYVLNSDLRLYTLVHKASGSEGDATAFSEFTVESISRKLGSFGFHRRGLEVMYNGHTGSKLSAQIFIGPTNYQRLKHMVQNKIHSRGRGPVNILTRQPVEGRSREGGLRFGEMERYCMISHGTALFLKERLNDVADALWTHSISFEKSLYL
ncbi:4437_t:CDS:10 [Funneliformis caledonium]|uniref:DNA-directed RNA polymerase n=1 Tax=Funneliformis caledonium TaxID=1117310 RepID=A0A9N8ZGQ1_9GLOM|nr:4437_t:CDS:10 [Funneliformis caledonium]